MDTQTPVAVRWCSDHKKNLPADQFYRTGNLCKACARIRSRQYAEEHRAELHGYQKARRDRLRSSPDGWAQYQLPILRVTAKKLGLSCSVTQEDLVKSLGDLVCPITGVKMGLDVGSGETSATVVRFNSELGFDRGNVGIVSRRAAGYFRGTKPAEIFALANWLQDELTQPLTTISENPA